MRQRRDGPLPENKGMRTPTAMAPHLRRQWLPGGCAVDHKAGSQVQRHRCVGPPGLHHAFANIQAVFCDNFLSNTQLLRVVFLLIDSSRELTELCLRAQSNPRPSPCPAVRHPTHTVPLLTMGHSSATGLAASTLASSAVIAGGPPGRASCRSPITRQPSSSGKLARPARN